MYKGRLQEAQPFLYSIQKKVYYSGSSEIWSDKLSLLHIKVTQRGGEHGGESRQSHGGAEGTKSDRGVVYVLLITLVINE